MQQEASVKRIVSHVASRTFASLGPVSKPEPSERICGSVRFIARRYAETLQLGQIARHVGWSKYHFLRRFRKEVGITPCMFLQRYRICAAMEELVKSMADIGIIAKKVGYRDPTSFSRAFLKVTGTQPSLYRLTRQRVG